MKIASWNINSINARLHHVLKWLEEHKPDFLFLQELKSQEENFPYEELKNVGYYAHTVCQKSYNGVAIITPHPDTENISKALPFNEEDDQARFISLEYKNLTLINIYLPNGNGEEHKYTYKLDWMKRLYKHSQCLLAQDKAFLIGGDFNVIPHAEDCYSEAAWTDDALYKLPTRQAFRSLLHLGLTDAFRVFNKDAGQYSFWDYQAGRWPKDEGIRIDHFLTSPKVTDRLKNCLIDKHPRGKEKASDHTPIIIELENE